MLSYCNLLFSEVDKIFPLDTPRDSPLFTHHMYRCNTTKNEYQSTKMYETVVRKYIKDSYIIG